MSYCIPYGIEYLDEMLGLIVGYEIGGTEEGFGVRSDVGVREGLIDGLRDRLTVGTDIACGLFVLTGDADGDGEILPAQL